jgi:hypothetical protein
MNYNKETIKMSSKNKSDSLSLVQEPSTVSKLVTSIIAVYLSQLPN